MNSSIAKNTCRIFTILFLGLILILPIIVIFKEAFSAGVHAYFNNIFHEYTIYAFLLSVAITAVSVIASTIFGVAAAWCISFYQFKGKTFLNSVIDLPISISPIIIGLSFILIYGKNGFLGRILESAGVQIIFSWPGLMLTNMCIVTPFVLRSILPSMQGINTEQEQIAKLLGANGWQILMRITLPRIKWALLYGIILATARSIGEFGAASIVSGLIRKKTVTLPLLVEIYYNEYLSLAAYASASIFIFLGIGTLIAKYISNKKDIQLKYNENT